METDYDMDATKWTGNYKGGDGDSIPELDLKVV
jgi:hypothetical protein